MKLSRTDVCKRVPMSLATFDRWRKAGKLETFTDGTLSNAKKEIVWVTLEAIGKALQIADETTLRLRLGLPEIEPEILPIEAFAKPAPEPKPERVPDIREPDAFAPKEAEFQDSFGHSLTDNKQHRMFETQPHVPQDKQAHMDPALLSNAPNPVADVRKPWDTDGSTRRGGSLAVGYSQDQYDKDIHDWNRTHFGFDRLSMSEQAEAIEQSKQAMHSAFPRNVERQRSLRDTFYTPKDGRL